MRRSCAGGARPWRCSPGCSARARGTGHARASSGYCGGSSQSWARGWRRRSWWACAAVVPRAVPGGGSSSRGGLALTRCRTSARAWAGTSARIADVAGFARAFGLAVPKERPDHFCAEVELAAFLTLGEAEALERGDRAGAEVYGSAAAAFLRDHLGCWLDLLAARAQAAAPAGPWGPVLGALDRFVAAEAARRGVAPRRHGRIDGGIDEAGEEGPPTCGACPAAGTSWQQGPLTAEGGTT